MLTKARVHTLSSAYSLNQQHTSTLVFHLCREKLLHIHNYKIYFPHLRSPAKWKFYASKKKVYSGRPGSFNCFTSSFILVSQFGEVEIFRYFHMQVIYNSDVVGNSIKPVTRHFCRIWISIFTQYVLYMYVRFQQFNCRRCLPSPPLPPFRTMNFIQAPSSARYWRCYDKYAEGIHFCWHKLSSNIDFP